MCYGKLGIVVQARRSLKSHLAVREDKSNMAKAWAWKALGNTSELWELVKQLNRTIGGDPARIAGLVDAELIRITSVVTATFLENEGRFRNAMCVVLDYLPA